MYIFTLNSNNSLFIEYFGVKIKFLFKKYWPQLILVFCCMIVLWILIPIYEYKKTCSFPTLDYLKTEFQNVIQKQQNMTQEELASNTLSILIFNTEKLIQVIDCLNNREPSTMTLILTSIEKFLTLVFQIFLFRDN